MVVVVHFMAHEFFVQHFGILSNVGVMFCTDNAYTSQNYCIFINSFILDCLDTVSPYVHQTRFSGGGGGGGKR